MICKFFLYIYCGTIGSIHFHLCWRQSENLFVCFGAKPTQKAWGWDLLPYRKWTRERRSQRRQGEFSWQSMAGENSRLEIVVHRGTQSAEGGSEKMEAEQRRESTEIRKTTAKTYWPTEAGLTNARRCQHC